jgi:hypothetical protein
MKKYFLAFFIFFLFFESFSQDKPMTTDSLKAKYEFTLKDGSKLIGEIIDRDNESYKVKTTNFGIIKINNDQVVSFQLLDANVIRNHSNYLYDNQFGHKYFILPSAIPVERNKLYYNNQFLSFSNFTYGISNRVSAGLSFFTFVPTSFISPSIKVTVNPKGSTKFALRGQYLFINGNNKNNLGLIQAIVTRGTSQNNVTLAIGKFISDRRINEISLLTLGFAKKISSKLSFISENNFILGTNTVTASGLGFGLLSGGLRFDRKMHAFDLGLYIPTSSIDKDLFLIPYVGFNLKLNK